MPRSVRRPSRDAFTALAADQDGVVSRAQLADLGWDADHVASEVTARRWAAYGHRAVVLHRGPLTTRQRRWVAVLNAGATATLAGLTAAEELGLRGFETETIHVVVVQDAWVPHSHPGVKVHVSRRFDTGHRHPARLLPTVRITRALVDAAAWTRFPRRAAAIVTAGVQQRLARPDQLRTELEAAGHVRHRRYLLAVLHDVEGGAQALSELDFVRLCRRSSLPTPERQRRRRGADGRIRYLDAVFIRRDGRVLNVEIDGAAHFDVLAAWADMDRDIALLELGEPTVRIPSAILRADPQGVARRLRALLDAPF
ncbi:hypothetical protein ABN034_10635 [Actinopolymorpha sp. B11F2]|uniref:hypothetical protein n=1 Tax=Actinopolymorpha sp. B11F2 TaxID=3160862 RepID=UPI0032E4EEE7